MATIEWIDTERGGNPPTCVLTMSSMEAGELARLVRSAAAGEWRPSWVQVFLRLFR